MKMAWALRLTDGRIIPLDWAEAVRIEQGAAEVLSDGGDLDDSAVLDSVDMSKVLKVYDVVYEGGEVVPPKS